MSVKFDTSTDKLQGACPAIGTGQFSWGFWFRPASLSDGEVGWIMDAANPFVAPSLSIEMSEGVITLFTAGLGSAGGPTVTADDIAAGKWFYIVVSRATSDYVRFRVFVDSSTPATDNDTGGDTSAVNYNCPNRGYGAIGSNTVIANTEIESEKWELGYAWTNAEAWAEAAKYALQRSGGTCEIQCNLTDVTSGLVDQAGTVQSLTNTGAVVGTYHPGALEGGLTLTPSGSEVSMQSGTPSVETSFNSLVGIRLRWP